MNKRGTWFIVAILVAVVLVLFLSQTPLLTPYIATPDNDEVTCTAKSSCLPKDSDGGIHPQYTFCRGKKEGRNCAVNLEEGSHYNGICVWEDICLTDASYICKCKCEVNPPDGVPDCPGGLTCNPDSGECE